MPSLSGLSGLSSAPSLATLRPLAGLSVIGKPVPREALRPLEAYDSPEDESLAMKFLSGGASALGYLGTSVFDALLGRRVRAAAGLLTGVNKPGMVSELFTVPVVSDLVGWTNPQNTVTGKELLRWDDKDSYLDDIAGLAFEIASDPTTYMTFGATGLFGAATKGRRILQAAGLERQIVKSASMRMTKEMGRKVGRREAAARLRLADIDAQALGKDATKALDDASTHYGFDSFEKAQQALGKEPLQAAFGFTYKPMSSIPQKIIPGGESFLKLQKGLDEAGHWISSTAMANQFRKKFYAGVRGATHQGLQEELLTAADDIRKRKARVTGEFVDHATALRDVGLAQPEAFQLLDLMSELVVERGGRAKRLTPPMGKVSQMDLPAIERNPSLVFDEIIANTKVGKRVASGKTPEQIAEMRNVSVNLSNFLRKHWDEDRIRAADLGISEDIMDDVERAYNPGIIAHIPDLKGGQFAAPKRVTDDMMRQLQSPRVGMTEQQIFEQEAREIAKHGDVRGLWEKAYTKERLSQVRDMMLQQEKAARSVRPTGMSQKDIVDTIEQSSRKRKEVYRGLTHSAIDAAFMDSRLVGPDAGQFLPDGTWQTFTIPERTDLFFREFYGGDPDLLRAWMRETGSKNNRFDYKNFDRYEKSGVWSGNPDLSMKPDPALAIKYGEFAPPGMSPDDIITSRDELRVLHERMNVLRHQYANSADMVDELRLANPRHVYEQRPLYATDPVSRSLNSSLGRETHYAHAEAAHRAGADAASLGLKKGQGDSVLEYMELAGIGNGDTDKILSNFIGIGLDDTGRESWSILGKEMSSPEILKYLAPFEGEKYLQGATVMGRETRKVNPDWLDWVRNNHRIKMQFGFDKFKESAHAGKNKIQPLYQEKLAELLATPKGQKLSGTRLERVKSRLYREAERESLKTYAEPSDARRVRLEVEKEFSDGFHEPYRVPTDLTQDARNTSELVGNPKILQEATNFWDKLTNTLRGNLTSSFLSYLTRNGLDTLMMTHITTADNVANLGPTFRAVRDSLRFHSGKVVKDMHKMPVLRGKVKYPAGATSEMKDALATEAMRTVFAAAEPVNPHGVGAMLQDVRVGGPGDVVEILDRIPGIGRHKAGWKAAAKAVTDAFREAHEAAMLKGSDTRGLGGITRASHWANNILLGSMLTGPTGAVRGGFEALGGTTKARSTNVWMRLGEGMNNWAESTGRTATWFALLRKGVDPVEAATRANAAHVDYSKLTAFERDRMRRFIPFYTFTRHRIPHLLRETLRHPGGPLTNMIRAVNVANGERRENAFVPQQLQGQLALPLYDSADGRTRAYIKPSLPVDVLNQAFSLGPDAYTTFQNTVLGWASMAHPLIRGAIDTAYGRSSFQKGRNLEDMYSRIGVRDPILNQIVMQSPAARYVTTLGIAADERKNIAEKLSSLVLGTPIMHVDMQKAQDEALDRALNKLLSVEEGVSRADKFYVRDETQLTERGKALMKLRTTRSVSAMREAKKKKQAEGNQRAGIMPPDLLSRLGK